MKRLGLVFLAIMLVLTSVALGQPEDTLEPGASESLEPETTGEMESETEMPEAAAAPSELPSELPTEPSEPATPPPPPAANRKSVKSTPEAVPAPVPADAAEYHEEPLWPDYYGPAPYNGCGFDHGCDIQFGVPACDKCVLQGGWAQFDYLLWWGKGARIPALVTTSPEGTSLVTAGTLPSASTTVLFGNDRQNLDARSGGRINFGMWLDGNHDVGLGASYVGIGRSTDSFEKSSRGNPILARPFLNANTGLPDSEIVAYPNFARGTIKASTTSNFMAADVFLREALGQGSCHRFDIVYGYRFARLDESVTINDRTISTDPLGLAPLGTSIVGHDNFQTRNTFNGGQIGLWYQRQGGALGWDAMGRIALGNMHEVAVIHGNTVVTVPGSGTSNQSGSLLALPTNIGQYRRNDFAVIPEAQFNLTYQFRPWMKARVGYTFLYISKVSQAGPQIDTTVNPTQIGDNDLVGPARPAMAFHTNGYWIQGINLGLEFNF